MSGHDAFERILTSLHEAMLDDVHWPTTTALIDEACGLTSNALLVGEGPKDDLRVGDSAAKPGTRVPRGLPSHRRTCAAPAATARPVGPGRAVPGPRERPPPRPEQYGAVPHIDSGILPICPSIVRRHGIPLCTGRGTWVANYYSARNPLRLSSLVILGVVARMFRCATRSSCWCT